ncbi:Zinc finger BED domain-containing protein RICESLEEPER [Quillaja saponaria]|uniref:Zinc finger BED domain-containing protein RICESLEEPER n=1 Tax=Quillaja saponaria TaxID=32244 RepID=A0AAD7LAG5_QUISA|nr:Zinc finger BED domain-containing protein RICESLEEPER [Quillaja saponaria]
MDLAKMIIVHGYPLSDHIGFRKFIYGLQPTFKMVLRNTVKADIMKIYDCEKDNTMKLIKSSQSKVAITCDMWTASNQRKDNYFDKDVMPRTKDFDVLLWWKLNGIKYLTLQAISRDLLVILVSTIASESTFSTGERLISPFRSRLHSKTSGSNDVCSKLVVGY